MTLTPWTRYRQTRAQKKKALHLLTLSGVVRPSSIELRYTTPLFHRTTEPTPLEQPAIIQTTLSITPPSPIPTPSSRKPLGTSNMLNGLYLPRRIQTPYPKTTLG